MNNNRKELELPVKPFNEMEDAFMNRAIFFKDLKPMLTNVLLVVKKVAGCSYTELMDIDACEYERYRRWVQ